MINFFKYYTNGRVEIQNSSNNQKALLKFDKDKNLTFDLGEINGLFENSVKGKRKFIDIEFFPETIRNVVNDGEDEEEKKEEGQVKTGTQKVEVAEEGGKTIRIRMEVV